MVEEKTMIHKFAGTLGSMPLGALILSALSVGLLLLGTPSFVALAASASPLNLDRALAAQQETVAERPYDAEVHNDHGNLLVLAGRHEEAGDAYRRAIELAPGETLARYNLGILLQQTGSIKQALAAFQDLLAIDARHARAHYQLGMLFEARRQRSKAVDHYAQAFAYDPELTFARNNPHIIDNNLATEALLVSRRYGEAPSSEMPRLYGEPERIVDLMLEESQESGVEAAGVESAGKGEKNMGMRSTFVDEGEDEVVDEEDDDGGEDAEGRGRRSLTRKDLDTGTSVGRVQSQPSRQPSRRSSAGRDSSRSRQGRGGFPVVRPPSRDSSERDQGRVDGRSNRRYRPTSRFSTGRLDLELLTPGTATQRNAATATR